MKHLTLVLSLALAAASLPGCSATEANNYVLNRGGDIADVIEFQLMAGRGIAAKAEATRLVHLGGAYQEDVGAIGLAHRELARWSATARSWGLLFGYHEETDVTRIGRFSGSYGWNFYDEGPGAFQEADPLNQLDLLTFRATLMLFLGVDLQLKVGEVVDFVAGIFQFDPAGDDVDSTEWVKHS